MSTIALTAKSMKNMNKFTTPKLTSRFIKYCDVKNFSKDSLNNTVIKTSLLSRLMLGLNPLKSDHKLNTVLAKTFEFQKKHNTHLLNKRGVEEKLGTSLHRYGNALEKGVQVGMISIASSLLILYAGSNPTNNITFKILFKFGLIPLGASLLTMSLSFAYKKVFIDKPKYLYNYLLDINGKKSINPKSYADFLDGQQAFIEAYDGDGMITSG